MIVSFIFIFISTLKSITPETFSKTNDFTQNDKTHKIELRKNLKNISFSNRDINRINVVRPMIKEDEDTNNENFIFEWENNDDCELSNDNKQLKKIKNHCSWKTIVKGNKILRKNSINVFKIRVINNDIDKSGLYLGLARANHTFLWDPYKEEWLMSCDCTQHNSEFRNFKKKQIDEGDIVTFIVDLMGGNLTVKKNDITLGTIYDIPLNEDLVPCVLIYYMGNEIEIVE